MLSRSASLSKELIMKYVILAAAVLLGNTAAAHELTPTYPQFKPSYVDGVATTTMKMWNRREDVSFYQLDVYDENWNPIAFSAVSRLLSLDYLETRTFEVYVRSSDVDRVEFICTTSKLLKTDVESTGITSRICSRVK